MAFFGVRLLASAALLCAAALLASARASSLAIDVQLAPDGGVVVENSRVAFNPDGPPGWKMTDRFRGFRFELRLAASSTDSTESFMEATASLARQSRCFGWIQASPQRSTVVGEARCPKRSAATLETHLRASGELTQKLYANTKIRYHFPSFRVLSEPRYVGRTCFATPPHACQAHNSRPGE